MRITTLNVPADLREKYERILAALERFFYPRLARKPRLLSRARRQALLGVTYMFYAADLWRQKSEAEKQEWKNAAEKCGLNGWQLYLKDKVYRLMNNIPGDAVPSIYHQYFVGHIKIESPATKILITQRHPYTWWEWYKKPRRKRMYSKQKITERLTFPFKIALSRRTNLTAVGDLPYCYLLAKIIHFYEGHLFYTMYPIDIPLVSDWGYQEKIIEAPGGYVGTYELQIRLNDVQGEMWFDNIIAEHDGTNFARDKYCDNITREFFDEFFNVAMNWEPTDVPEGALYESIYPPDIIYLHLLLETGDYLLLEDGSRIRLEQEG